MTSEISIEPKELDQWIAKLEDCKQLEENNVKILCEKVHPHISFVYVFSINLLFFW